MLVDVDGPVARLVLNRPEELNAWTYSMEAAFFAALDEAKADTDVRVVVITGAGRGFCAGASMSLLGATGQQARPDPARRRRLIELADFPKPTIAAINGPAAGIGFALAVACDVRFAAARTKLTTSFARLGLVAEHGVSWLLLRLVGRAHASDLLLSGRTVTGAEAATMGLVNRAVDGDGTLAEAMAYARMLADTGSPGSWATIKRQLLDAEHQSLAAAYEEASALMESALASPDHCEGVSAFTQKRLPRFAPLSSQ